MPDTLRDQLQLSLGKDHVLIRELGGGGMSRVFLARDETLGRSVVVKVLALELVEGLSIERFTREIRLAAGLQEPHIVPVLTTGSTTSGLPYYTMPFVEGENLRARMKTGRMPVNSAIGILRDVANALAHAHARGIVHRDIKPENILLSSGTAVVTDFGIAKAMQLSRTDASDGAMVGTLTRTGTSLGTPAYMAPEQAAGDPNTDQRADIYAWGVVAYELLTGAHPFATRTTPQQLLAAHMTETPAALSTRASDISAELAALVMRALAKDPNARPASALELLTGLTDVDGSPRVAPVQSRRSALLAIVGLASIAFIAWFGLHKSDGKSSTALRADPVMMAVLPFEHEGPADQLPFTNGLTDAVTAKLSALKSLAVIDRRSAATYRGTTKTAKQIGSELGVKYLLNAVVRWAKDGAGTWKARVTPTLVDAESGMTKWMGDPQDITLDDPFTAQGAIATDVSTHMQVVLLPDERAAFAHRFSDNPQAFADYERGMGIFDAATRTVDIWDPAMQERAAAEFEHAISLDSNFGDAWARLAYRRLTAAALSDDDAERLQRARDAVKRATARAGTHPLSMLALATLRLQFDKDTTGVDALIAQAMQRSPNDADLLINAAFLMQTRGRTDSAFAFASRSARLDPRSASALDAAGQLAITFGRLDEALNAATKLEALDSTDVRGAALALQVAYRQGDTLRLKTLLERAIERFPDGSYLTRGFLAYAGRAHANQFMALTTAELGIVTPFDSADAYYDNKTDAALSIGDVAMARVYSDSVRRVLEGRRIRGFDELNLGTTLAFAQANTGALEKSRETLARTLQAARATNSDQYPAYQLRVTAIAATYARLGNIVEAIRWLDEGLKKGNTVSYYRMAPKLKVLNGTPAFDAFLRRHAQ